MPCGEMLPCRGKPQSNAGTRRAELHQITAVAYPRSVRLAARIIVHMLAKLMSIFLLAFFVLDQIGISLRRIGSYPAAKSGLAGLTRMMSNELAAHGINVNAIAPGYMATDNTAALQADAARNKSILERIPAAAWGSPADMAGAVVFLASPASDYVHGHLLAVDGGWLGR